MKIILSIVCTSALWIIFISLYLNKTTGTNNDHYMLTTNIAIAFGTCIAALFTFMSFIEAKKNKKWELKKEPTLKVMLLTTQLLEHVNALEDNCACITNGDVLTHEIEDAGLYLAYNKELNYLLAVYSPLYPSEVITAINTFLAKDADIDASVENSSLDVMSAYSELSDALKILQGVFIKHMEKSI